MSEIILLDLNLIDEDPNQPRTKTNQGFSEKSLRELAETIKERGVKSPISVRDAGNGRYLINHGARRYRASIVAGLTEIPVHIDNDYTKLDQVIENIQREALSPREIADYIGYRVSQGAKKSDLAKELGKSNSWISQHCILLDLPEPIAKAMNNGKVSDLTAITELTKLYSKNPNEVSEWIEESEDISRNTINVIKEFIDSSNIEEPQASYEIKFQDSKNKPGPKIGSKARIFVLYNGVKCELKSLKPSTPKHAIIDYNQKFEEVLLSDLELYIIE